MEREPIDTPMKCFGMEQNATNPLCKTCEHRKPCAELMGSLMHRVDLDKVRFCFMPPGLASPNVPDDHYSRDPSARDIEAVYVRCHKQIFGSKPRGQIGRLRKKILERAAEAGVSVKLFFLTNMLAWQQARFAQAFVAKVLTAESSVKQVEVFALLCRERYGSFDLASFDLLLRTDTEERDTDRLLLNSEIIAGSWLIAFKLFHEGSMLEKFYEEQELALHPCWLAIEPSYKDIILDPNIEKIRRYAFAPTGDPITQHRWNVLNMLKELKRNNRVIQARMLFRKREQIMPEAVRRVLALRGFQPAHFQIEDIPVVTPMKFWGRLGQAIQHFECMNFVDKLPSVLDAYIAAHRIGSGPLR